MGSKPKKTLLPFKVLLPRSGQKQEDEDRRGSINQGGPPKNLCSGTCQNLVNLEGGGEGGGFINHVPTLHGMTMAGKPLKQ